MRSSLSTALIALVTLSFVPAARAQEILPLDQVRPGMVGVGRTVFEGKLLGAVAYGFPFSKETIGGITPIGEMIEATRTDAPRAASTRFPTAFGAAGPALPLDREALIAALRRPMQAISV